MATIPSPRSYSAIVGDMLDALLSKLGFPSVRVGSGTLSIIEAAAQSDLRSSQDVFNLLNSTSLDRATGQALDRLGLDEDAPRTAEAPASGQVTISDSSFSRVSTKIFQGKAPPIVGSPYIYVTDALLFPASGSIYVGRGTTNYEGPLVYTSKTNNINYWTLNLSPGNYTTKYHNLGESVVLAQGGDRLVPAGTIVQTAQANTSSAVQFSVLYAATIPDGEVSVSGVIVVARTPGVVGNVIAGSINNFPSAPFTGATVTNPSPFSNGLATEDDNTYRERLRAVRQSRSRATPLAIKTGITGITSLEENKRVISCSVVRRQDYPTTVYLDDGTGYEEVSVGVALETLVDEALGGEQYFQLVHGRPVSKAYIASEFAAPFTMVEGSVLSVLVGGRLSEHVFPATDFRSIGNASAYEVVASINSDVDLDWSARTTGAGTKVAIFAKNDTEEDIEVVSPAVGLVDANDVLGFSIGRADTLRLYKNDILLSKDGQLATVTGNTQGAWAAISAPATLQIRIDGVDVPGSTVPPNPPNTYTINNIDFINAGTGYLTVSAGNSAESWARVLNYKIPGITAEVIGGAIAITSNRGRSSQAGVEILGGTLATNGMFDVASATGKDLDYTLDRNLGQIRLEDSLILHEGDRLAAGSYATRAFLESDEITTLSIAGTANTTVSGEAGAELWFAVDGAAEVIPTGVGVSTPITLSDQGAYPSGGSKTRIAHTPGTTTLFENAQPGDWIVLYDPSIAVLSRGAWRIVAVNGGGLSVDIETSTGLGGPVNSVLTIGGIAVVRTTADLQRVYLPNNANYTAASLVSGINSQLRGATAGLYRTRQFRVRTNTFAIDGDIALVASNVEGLKLGLPVGSATANQTSHLAAIVAGHSEIGTPQFEIGHIVSAPSGYITLLGADAKPEPHLILMGLKHLNDAGDTRYTNIGHATTIEYVSGNDVYTRRPAVKGWMGGDRFYAASPYAMTADDEMTVVVDGDTASKRFVVPMFRRVKPGSNTYGATNDFKDADNSNGLLTSAFGSSMDWRDFAVFMPARTKSHASPDTNKTLLWRYKRLGSDGNQARLQYIYPTAPNQTTLTTWSPLSSSYTDIKVRLPSGAARTGVTYSNNTKIGLSAQGPTAGLYTYQHVLNLPIASATREVRLNYTSGPGTLLVGDIVASGGGGTAAGWTISVISGGATGYLVLTGGSGTWLNGESIDRTTPATGPSGALASGTQYGYATLTLTLPAGITDHGFSPGNELHIEYNGTGTGAGFLSGNRIVTADSATSISFVEGVSAIAPTANVGTVSYDTAEVMTAGSTVVAGDIMNVGAGTSAPAEWKQSVKISTITNGHIIGQSPTVPQGAYLGATLQWTAINATSNLSWFPLGTTTITAISTAVNAQANNLVSTFLAGDGLGDTSGSITYATYEASPNGLGGTDPWYYFSDGLNWVRSTTTPPLSDTNFTFKNAVTPGLASNSDWVNETVRLVPITAENIADYLSTSGPGGLFANGETAVSTRGSRPQITTITAGSGGSVQVQGGTANSLTSVVRGQASQAGTNPATAVVTVATSDTLGLSAGHWMKLQNTVAVPKARITSSTALTSIGTNGVVVLSATTAWNWANTAAVVLTGNTWQVEKQGDFVAYHAVGPSNPDLAGVQEGDWVVIEGSVSAFNQGAFRIVRIANVGAPVNRKTFWIENPRAVEETATATTAFLTYDSVMPGDTLSINTPLWGANNLGNWTVTGINLGLSTLPGFTAAQNLYTFTLDTSTRTPVAQGAVGALGSSSNLVQVVEAEPSRLFKKVYAISQNPSDPALTDIKFSTWAGGMKVSESAETILYSLDKLAFDTRLATGIDGYRHSTGLIEEANKVGYGVDADPSTYPGLIAAGATVNIEGPLIHRISVSLSLRIRSGVSARDIKSATRSAVAAYVNAIGVGKQVSLSEIVTAAQGVNGVVSVTILSPSYGSGNDLISIQPYEKPMVLNLDDDIQISFVGE